MLKTQAHNGMAGGIYARGVNSFLIYKGVSRVKSRTNRVLVIKKLCFFPHTKPHTIVIRERNDIVDYKRVRLCVSQSVVGQWV